MIDKKRFISVAKFAGLIGAVVLGNYLLQSYLGKQAIKNSGIEVLSLQEALDKAQQTDRLVLADMSAVYCPTCRKLSNEIFANAQVQQQIASNYVYARIEYSSDAGDEFMQKYQVSGFPTVLILDNQGQKLTPVPLTFDPNKYTNMLATAAAEYAKL